MPDHEHDFRKFVGIPVFAKKRTAWVRADMTTQPDAPVWMWVCDTCGEQGYEVKA